MRLTNVYGTCVVDHTEFYRYAVQPTQPGTGAASLFLESYNWNALKIDRYSQ